MTPTERLARLAIEVARSAPKKRGTYVSHCLVYWPLIEQIREIMDECDVQR